MLLAVAAASLFCFHLLPASAAAAGPVQQCASASWTSPSALIFFFEQSRRYPLKQLQLQAVVVSLEAKYPTSWGLMKQEFQQENSAANNERSVRAEAQRTRFEKLCSLWKCAVARQIPTLLS